MPKTDKANLPSPDEAAKLLEADAELALKGVTKDGKLTKKLSPSLRKQLQKIAAGIAQSGETIAPNFRKLAAAVGVSYVTLYDWKKRYPDNFPKPKANNSYSIPEVKAWFDKVRNGGEPKAVVVENPKAQLEIERGNVKLERERFQLGVQKRDYVKRDEVNQHVDTANAIVTRELVKAFIHELPPLQEGLSAAEIQTMNEERLKEVMEQLPKHLAAEIE